MTYNEIIEIFKRKVQGHFFINEFGYGDISDISTPDDGKAPYYPYIFLNPISISTTDQVSSFNFNLICMTQCRDDSYQVIKKQSDCMDNLRDIIAQVNNTLNDPLVEIQEPFSFTPFKERFQDDVVGATVNLTVTYPSLLDACNTPIADPNYCLIADTFSRTNASVFNTTYTFGGWGYWQWKQNEFSNNTDDFYEFICDTRYAWFKSIEPKYVAGTDPVYPVMGYIDTGYPDSTSTRLPAFYIFYQMDGTSFECGSTSSLNYHNADINGVSYVNTTNDNGWVYPTEGWVKTFDPDDSEDRSGNVYIFETDCTNPKPSPTAAPIPPPSPTPTPTVSTSPTPTITPTPSPSIEPSPSATPTITPTASVTVTPSVTATQTPTPTPTPSPFVASECINYDVTGNTGSGDYFYLGDAVITNTGSTLEITCTGTTSLYYRNTGGDIYDIISYSELSSDYVNTSGWYAAGGLSCGDTESITNVSVRNTIDYSEYNGFYYPTTGTITGETYPYTLTNIICPSPSPTPSITPTNSVTPTVTPSVTTSVTATPSVTPSVTSSVTPSITPSITPTNTITPTASVTVTPSVTITPSVTVTPSTTPPEPCHIIAQNGDEIIAQNGDYIDHFPCPDPSPTPSVTATVTPTITPTPSTSVPAGDADANAYIAAIIASGGTADATTQSAIQTLFTDLKSAGLYSKMFAFYPVVGGVAASHAINAKRNTTYDLTFAGGWTHGTSGMTSNGSTAYANTHATPQDLGTNGTGYDNHHQLITVNDNTIRGYEGAGPGTNGYLITRSQGSEYFSNGSIIQVGIQYDNVGQQILNRTAVNSMHGQYQASGGTITKTVVRTNTASNITTGDIWIGGVSNTSFKTSNRYIFQSIGDGLTDSEVSDLFAAINTFNNSLGRRGY